MAPPCFKGFGGKGAFLVAAHEPIRKLLFPKSWTVSDRIFYTGSLLSCLLALVAHANCGLETQFQLDFFFRVLTFTLISYLAVRGPRFLRLSGHLW